MKVTKKPFGTMPDGVEVSCFEIASSAGATIMASPYGATLISCRVADRHGDVAEVTLGYDALDSYLGNHPYFGATIGRYANRIAEARFSIDNAVYELPANEGPNQLHGGPGGFSRRLWNAEAFGESDRAGVAFRRTSPDGEEGYPGALDVEVRFTLTEEGELVFDYSAACTKPTVVNLTNHSYWNLGGADSGSVADHVLTLDCDEYLPVDSASIPTGSRESVAETPMDFRTARSIRTEWEQVRHAAPGVFGYDHCYVVRGAGLRRVAAVHSPSTGRTMEVYSDQPGVQLYTGNLLGGHVGRDGRALHAHDALCLETQDFPDAPNRPEFPSVVLRPGDTYSRRTIHRFSIDQ